jgi:signal transduction histidine kinase
MDSVQTLLIVVVISLTVLLVVVGFQVMLIIIDLRKAIKRLNSILEDAILGGGLIRPEKLSSVLELLHKGKKLETHGG